MHIFSAMSVSVMYEKRIVAISATAEAARQAKLIRYNAFFMEGFIIVRSMDLFYKSTHLLRVVQGYASIVHAG